MTKRSVDPSDYIRAHAGGFVHLHLLSSRLEYVSAVIVDTYVTDRGVAAELARLSQVSPGYSDISFARKQEIIRRFLTYLQDEYERHSAEAALFRNQAVGSHFIIRAVTNSLESGRSLQRDIENEEELFGTPPAIAVDQSSSKESE
jgi:hypothetical protein